MTHEQMIENLPTDPTHEQLIEQMDDRLPVDLCADCVIADANGTDELGGTPWRGFLPEWDGWLFGHIACGGTDDDDLYCEGHFAPPGRACDGCGTTLGGDRYCYVAVKR